MSVAVDKFGYKLPYAKIFGGATALTPDQFRYFLKIERDTKYCFGDTTTLKSDQFRLSLFWKPNKRIFGVSSKVKSSIIQLLMFLLRRLNGFSNVFWGWGGEDDDMAARVQSQGEFSQMSSNRGFGSALSAANLGMRIERYSEEIARYRMIKHKPEKPNKMRWSLLKSSKRRFVIGVFENLIFYSSRENEIKNCDGNAG